MGSLLVSLVQEGRERKSGISKHEWGKVTCASTFQTNLGENEKRTFCQHIYELIGAYAFQ